MRPTASQPRNWPSPARRRDARSLSSAPASAIRRDVVCSSMRQGVFNTFITPNHNADHDNHFHFDVVLGEPGIFAE